VSRRPKEREVFARTMVALQPYAADVVLIGGWVHALYIAEFNALSEAIYTTDIDVTIPSTLAAGDRPTLVELARRAGFSADDLDRAQGTVSLSQGCEGGSIIDLDLLTEAPNPTIPVRIHGQPGLVVPGYPDQCILLDNARWTRDSRHTGPAAEDPGPHTRSVRPGEGALIRAADLTSEAGQGFCVSFRDHSRPGDEAGGAARNAVAARLLPWCPLT